MFLQSDNTEWEKNTWPVGDNTEHKQSIRGWETFPQLQIKADGHRNFVITYGTN